MHNHKMNQDPLMELYHSNSLNILNDKFKKICENYFIETYALAILEKSETSNLNSDTKSSCFENYPLEWMERYKSLKYYLKDPVYEFSKNITQAHYWHIDNFVSLSQEQKVILSEASDFGIKRGTTIPLLPNKRFTCFLTLMDTNIHHPEVLYTLANASHIYLNRKQSLEHMNVFQSLTEKEIRVLSLKAKGYLIKQISAELSISDATVLFHFKNIKKKLNLSAEQAVFKYLSTFHNA